MASTASWIDQPLINQTVPSFPWEYTLKSGNEAFWEDLGLKDTVRFTQKYTQEEPDTLYLDPSLPTTEKFSLLRKLIEERLADSEIAVKPKELKDIDISKWIRLNFTIAGFSHNPGDLEKAIEICHRVLKQSPKSIHFRQLLSYGLMDCQQWVEAEESALTVITEMNEKWGEYSPQSFGTYRLLIKITGKQEHFKEADEYLATIDHDILKLSGTQFEKYTEIEKTARKEVASELQDMKNNSCTAMERNI
jgi:hypothetical protein